MGCCSVGLSSCSKLLRVWGFIVLCTAVCGTQLCVGWGWVGVGVGGCTCLRACVRVRSMSARHEAPHASLSACMPHDQITYLCCNSLIIVTLDKNMQYHNPNGPSPCLDHSPLHSFTQPSTATPPHAFTDRPCCRPSVCRCMRPACQCKQQHRRLDRPHHPAVCCYNERLRPHDP